MLLRYIFNYLIIVICYYLINTYYPSLFLYFNIKLWVYLFSILQLLIFFNIFNFYIIIYYVQFTENLENKIYKYLPISI